MNLLKAFDNFLVYLRLHKGRSRKTQEQYAFHIWRFINYISFEIFEENKILKLSSEDFLPPIIINEKNPWKSPIFYFRHLQIPDIEKISKEDFDEWRLSLADSGLSTKTTNAHIITIRSWLKYLKKEEIDCLDPTSLDLIKTDDREVTFLTSEEIDSFFANISTETIQ